MSHQLIISLFLVFFFLEFLVEIGLSELNLAYVRNWSGKLPEFIVGVMSRQEYDKSVEYTVAKGRFQRWAAIYDALATLWILFGGVLPVLDRFAQTAGAFFPPATHALGIIFCLGVGIIFSLLSLPTDIYSTFVLEERFGFNKTTPRLYVIDKLKGLLLTLLIGIPFLFVVLWLMDTAGAQWWLWVFLFILAFQLLMIVLYPSLIAPLFNKFEPLKEGELRGRILALVEQTGLPKYTFESENWEEFMEYGYLFDGSVDLKRFTLKQKVALLRLIMTRPIDLQKDTGRRLILDLLEAVDKNQE